MPTGGASPYKTENGVLFKGTTLVQYPRNKQEPNYTVPSWAKEIAPRAIDAVLKIKSINLNQVTKLGLTSIYS